MCTLAVVSTLFSWFVGLILDANLFSGDYTGFLALRILFPIIVMGLFVMKSNNGK